MSRNEYFQKRDQERSKTHTRFTKWLPNDEAKELKKFADREGYKHAIDAVFSVFTAYLKREYYISHSLKEPLDRLNSTHRDSINDLRNIARSLNQIAKKANKNEGVIINSALVDVAKAIAIVNEMDDTLKQQVNQSVEDDYKESFTKG